MRSLRRHSLQFGLDYDKRNPPLCCYRLTEVASSGLVQLQNRTRAGLEYAVSQQTVSSILSPGLSHGYVPMEHMSNESYLIDISWLQMKHLTSSGSSL